MPYSKAAHAFFALCAGKGRGKARKKCPPKATSKKLMTEGIKK